MTSSRTPSEPLRPPSEPANPSASGSTRLLVAAEVAELLAVPERWVRERTRSGHLPAVKLGRYVRYDRGDVLAWVEVQKSGGAATSFRRHVPVPGGGTK